MKVYMQGHGKSFKLEHDAPSPFPRKIGDRVAVDERCQCWAPRSHHMDSIAYGHGACPPNKCDKFSFASFIFEPRVHPAPQRK
jgi:hypothetical protein